MNLTRSGRPATKLVTAGLAVMFACSTFLGAEPAAANPERSERAQAVLDRFSEPGSAPDAVLDALATGTIDVETPTLVSGQVAPPPVENGYVIEGSALAALDVTRTPEGQAEIAAFTNDLLARGLRHAAAQSFVVYSLPQVRSTPTIGPVDPDDTIGSLPLDTGPVDGLSEGSGPLSNALVVPGCDALALVGAVSTNAGTIVSTVLETVPAVGNAVTGLKNIACALSTPNVLNVPTPVDSMTGDPSDSDQWTNAGGLGCMRRKSNGTAWYDPCSYWYHRTGSVNNKEVWGLKQFGTGKSKGANYLRSLEARSWRKGGTASQTWNDWAPKADSDQGNCITQTVGINVNGATLEQSAQHCDKWDIDKGSEGGAFANTWRGSTYRSERATDAVIATSTAPGYYPTDYVRYDYEAAWW